MYFIARSLNEEILCQSYSLMLAEKMAAALAERTGDLVFMYKEGLQDVEIFGPSGVHTSLQDVPSKE